MYQEQEKNATEASKQPNESAQPAAPGAQADYIDAMKRLKENSVPRQEYDRVVADNKRMMDNFVNGQYDQVQEESKPLRKSVEIRKDLFGGKELTNLEHAKLSLELREAIWEESGHKTDIFVGQGHQLNPSAADYESANNVASVFEQCIEVANGDNEVFTNELMRRTNDVRLPLRR